MLFVGLLAGAMLSASAGESSPLLITPGDVLVQATGGIFLDPFSDTLVQGFFGSADGIPSNAVLGGRVPLEGDHSGAFPSGLRSNLQVVALEFNRGMPSATVGVWFTSTSDAALADTVLTLLDSVTPTRESMVDVDFGFQPFTMHSLAPFPVQYGEQPEAQIRYFDAMLSIGAAGGPGTLATAMIQTTEDSGQFFSVGRGLATRGTLTFTNPEMGAFSLPGLRVRAELSSGSWTVRTPEPRSVTLLILGVICVAARWRFTVRRGCPYKRQYPS